MRVYPVIEFKSDFVLWPQGLKKKIQNPDLKLWMRVSALALISFETLVWCLPHFQPKRDSGMAQSLARHKVGAQNWTPVVSILHSAIPARSKDWV